MTAFQIWRLPVILAIASAIGLLSGVLDDGMWDVISWLTLALPPATTVWCIARARG
jgi:hypothetical protein